MSSVKLGPEVLDNRVDFQDKTFVLLKNKNDILQKDLSAYQKISVYIHKAPRYKDSLKENTNFLNLYKFYQIF
jgi:hypothetical protein